MMRRIRIPICGALLAQEFEQGTEWAFEVVEGLPKGARAVAFWPGGTDDCIEMIVEHESFADIPEGEPLPSFTPVFRTGVGG